MKNLTVWEGAHCGTLTHQVWARQVRAAAGEGERRRGRVPTGPVQMLWELEDGFRAQSQVRVEVAVTDGSPTGSAAWKGGSVHTRLTNHAICRKGAMLRRLPWNPFIVRLFLHVGGEMFKGQSGLKGL